MENHKKIWKDIVKISHYIALKYQELHYREYYFAISRTIQELLRPEKCSNTILRFLCYQCALYYWCQSGSCN